MNIYTLCETSAQIVYEFQCIKNVLVCWCVCVYKEPESANSIFQLSIPSCLRSFCVVLLHGIEPNQPTNRNRQKISQNQNGNKLKELVEESALIIFP